MKLLEDVELKSERMVMIVEETEKEKATVQARLEEAERRLDDPSQRAVIERLRKDVATLESEKVSPATIFALQALPPHVGLCPLS